MVATGLVYNALLLVTPIVLLTIFLNPQHKGVLLFAYPKNREWLKTCFHSFTVIFSLELCKHKVGFIIST